MLNNIFGVFGFQIFLAFDFFFGFDLFVIWSKKSLTLSSFTVLTFSKQWKMEMALEKTSQNELKNSIVYTIAIDLVNRRRMIF